MQYFYSDNIEDNQIYLDEEESRHAIKILRKAIGDELFVLDGKGSLLRSEIISVGRKLTSLLIEVVKKENQPRINFTLGVCPTKKADRMEWMVEKATEIGVQKIVLLEGQNSERSRINLTRLKKKALSAMKQSGNLWLPQIELLGSLTSFITQDILGDKWIAHCYDTQKNVIQTELQRNQTVLIGPEGDFSTNELSLAITNNWRPLDLGKNRLRTETAAIVACTLINHFCVNLKE